MPHDQQQPEPTAASPKANQETSGQSDASGSTALDDSLVIVVQSFQWFNDATQQKLDALGKDLAKRDDAPFVLRALEVGVEVGLASGSAAAGEFLVHKLAAGLTDLAVQRELVKNLFVEGLKVGIDGGKAALGTADRSSTVNAFMDGQKSGVREAYKANQTGFIKHGRHKIKTAADAQALEDACSDENMRGAAEGVCDDHFETPGSVSLAQTAIWCSGGKHYQYGYES